MAYEYQPNPTEAEKAYQQAVHLGSADGIVYNRLGLFYYNQQRYHESISQYKKALEKQPDYPLYLENLALAYDMEKQWVHSLPLYEKLVQQSPTSYFLGFRLAIALYKIQRYNEAIDRFEQIQPYYSTDLVLPGVYGCSI